jgi:anti-sigma28 factor (negative regulator of flagellin synthesis)
MRIDPNVVVTPISTNENGKQQKVADGKALPLARSSHSVVVLSEAASSIAPEGDVGLQAGVSAKLDRIRALIDKGEYPVDLDKLAARIVDDELARAKKPS